MNALYILVDNKMSKIRLYKKYKFDYFIIRFTVLLDNMPANFINV